ncbi:MAG: hypothetical protein C0475_05065 [Planctomyces sp.]|nr:hypothetical protein [Planctomyces sp.]
MIGRAGSGTDRNSAPARGESRAGFFRSCARARAGPRPKNNPTRRRRHGVSRGEGQVPMNGLLGTLATGLDLAVVLGAFTLIIVIHELGHFLAARWAGIRVHAFAVGFGGAVGSYRRGLGFRRGSSEGEYRAMLRADAAGTRARVSATEYRWNWLPLGGYVKMLGQNDADPSQRSDEPDSYQSRPVWKRMVVIGAGVVMNLISAAALFVVVFQAGLRTEPPEIGYVDPDGPAAVGAAGGGGLRVGDRVLRMDGERVRAFSDIAIAAAMASGSAEMVVEVERAGEPVVVRLRPVKGPVGLLTIGVGPAVTGRLIGGEEGVSQRDRQRLGAHWLAQTGAALEPGMEVVGVGGAALGPSGDPVSALESALAASGGSAVEVLVRDGGQERTLAVRPQAEWAQTQHLIESAGGGGGGGGGGGRAGRSVTTEHLLGLAPVLKVVRVEEGTSAAAAGLRGGDVMARVGSAVWPSLARGIAELNGSAGRSVGVVVWRGGALVDLGQVAVSKEGRIGFVPGHTAQESALVAAWPTLPELADAAHTGGGGAGASASGPAGAGSSGPSAGAGSGAADAAQAGSAGVAGRGVWSGAGLGLAPGSRLVGVGGQRVETLVDVRGALQRAAGEAAGGPGPAGAVRVALEVEPPARPGVDAGSAGTETYLWVIPEGEARALGGLGWKSPLLAGDFEAKRVVLRSGSVLGAIGMGLHRTRQSMLQTYITFARLAQGTVGVEHLNGPVGIVHAGTVLAGRGWVWVLFFMGVVSVNLAVINFLPLPIVDGGHFLFLLYEQVTGRAVSVVVQNAAALAGLIAIGTVFLVVTYNDLARLLWP